MNIAALRTFLAVVQSGNLNKAACSLNVTQSTVTARLDALEDNLGQKLLVRARRGAALTKAGFAFLRHAELMVQTWDQARRIAGLPKGYSGLLSLGCHPELWDGLGSSLMDGIRRDQPDLALEAWPGDAAEIREWLSSGLVDAALVPEPISGSGIGSKALVQDRLVQVSTEARVAQAWDPKYLYVDHGADFRRWHTETWPGEETAHMAFGASRWALAYLLGAGGSAYLPWRLVHGYVQDGVLFPVEGAAAFRRDIFLCWRQASTGAFPWLPDVSVTDGAADVSAH